MYMETMNCGYLGNTSLPQPSAAMYAPTPYTHTEYAPSPPDSYIPIPSKYEDDDQNNNNFSSSYSTSISSEGYDDALDNSLSSQLSGMDLYESHSDDCATRPARKGKKSSKSKRSDSSDRGRKDSFVYDVRLPDEQYLFFVPDLDLVKSHLMFAVREEVEVLKEKIGELMDKITTLECENTLLRQYAPQDALQQCQPPQANQPAALPHHTSS